MDGGLNRFAVDLITRLLLERTGQALREDRQWRIEAAIHTVLRNRGIASTGDLVVLLTQPNGHALQQELVEALLNNETYFFRDRQIFDFIGTKVLPQLARAKARTRVLRIWSAGCSTGQEPLSLAMLFKRDPSSWRDWRIEIVATDISETALRVARNGTYSNFEVQRGLAVGQMLEHFEETRQGWRVSEGLLGMIRFERRNLLDGAPSGMRFDLILCRNVLLYFEDTARRRAWRNLALAMEPPSQLLLGGGEVVGGSNHDFTPSPGEFGMYRLRDRAVSLRAAIPA